MGESIQLSKETTMGEKTLTDEDKANYIKNFHG
jgi:hypothetical protein